MTTYYMGMIEDCEQRESKLNDWERGFIESIRDVLERDDNLTDNQIDKLEQIWDKVTN